MALARLRFLPCFVTALLVFPFPAAGFDATLSDTAVREAYFMGQRHDETMARFLGSYYQHLARPKSGPYVSSVAWLTVDSTYAAVGIVPPEGHQVDANFELYSLR